MAGLSARDQFATIAWLRWRVFVNGLRSKQRKAEAISGVFAAIGIFAIAFGPAIGLAFGAYYAVATNNSQLLPIFFWVVFVYWQFIPAISIAVTEVFDTSTFLRFPVTMSTYYWLWLAFGSLDPSLIPPLVWLCGMFVGFTIASPLLALMAALVLFTFALMNLLLSRLILAYVERWLAKRKTREIVGALLALVGIAGQIIPRLIGRYAVAHRQSPIWNYGAQFQQNLPPGIAARCIQLAAPDHHTVMAAGTHYASAFGEWAFLLAYTVLFGSLLAVRLRVQYRGENFSETSRRGKPEKRQRVAPVSRGWLAIPDPVGAIFEKEIRTLFGTRQVWITLFAPPLMLFVFGSMGSKGNPFSHNAWVLPLASAYGLLSISQFFFNSFSGELAGIQFLYLAPVTFRQIFTGKNIAHALLAGLQFLLLLVGVSVLFAPPGPAILVATIGAVAFALFTNLAVGNVISLNFPKKVDPTRLNRQGGSSVTGLILMGIQLGVMAIAAPIFLLARYLGSLWMAAAAFFVLAAVAFAVYRMALGKLDSVALRKRESLIAEFAKTA